MRAVMKDCPGRKLRVEYEPPGGRYLASFRSGHAEDREPAKRISKEIATRRNTMVASRVTPRAYGASGDGECGARAGVQTSSKSGRHRK